MAITTPTWTARDALAFTAGTLSDFSDCVSQVQQVLHRGTLSATTTPTLIQVRSFLTFAKQELCEEFGFTWKRKFSYANPAAGHWQLGAPADFGGGAYILRDITSNKRLSFVDPTTFDTLYPDPAGSSQAVPSYYTVKDREFWMHAPLNGTYTLELEYQRTGDDALGLQSSDDTGESDISYLPEIFRYKICNYAIYKSFLMLQNWTAAQAYKSEWEQGLIKSRRNDGKKKWMDTGYMAKAWYYPVN
ncbi:MAG: phage adaptor protein [Planctomycetota bacterium]|jgi:hypothetical protein